MLRFRNFLFLLNYIVGGFSLNGEEMTLEEPSPDTISSTPVLAFGLEHHRGFSDQIDDLTMFDFGLSYEYWGGDIFLRQGVTKLYVIDKDEKEVQFSDPRLGFSSSKPLANSGSDATLGFGLSFTLPFSEFSRRNQMLTRISGWGSVSQSFSEKIDGSLALTPSYFFGRYKSTPTGLGKNGGDPLPKMQVSLSCSLSYAFSTEVAVVANASYSQLWFQRSSRRNINSSGDSRGLLQEPYAIDLTFSYQIEKTSLMFGYALGTQVDPDSDLIDRIVIFDEAVSTYFVGMTAVI